MSANNIGILKKYDGSWYVFDTTAEEVVGDEENGNKRYLEITDKNTLGPYPSEDIARDQAPEDSILGYFEYGVTRLIELEGVKLVLTYESREVEEDDTCDPDEEDIELNNEVKIAQLERRVQNLEGALKTSSIIHKRLITALQKAGIEIDTEIKKPLVVDLFELNKGAATIEDIKKIEKKINAALSIQEYISQKNWKRDLEACYLVANWFELQVMTKNDLDEELTKNETTLLFLPLLTKKQAESLLRDQRENLALILS